MNRPAGAGDGARESFGSCLRTGEERPQDSFEDDHGGTVSPKVDKRCHQQCLDGTWHKDS